MIFVVATGFYLLIMAIIDLLKHEIPISGLIVGLGLIGLSFLPGGYPKGAVIELTYRLCGLIPGLIMLICAYLTKGKIGTGDGILCLIIGFAIGILDFCSVLSLSLLMIVAYSVVLLARGRLYRSKQIAFIPFLFLGFLLYSIGL